MATANVSFWQLLVAFFVAILLAHVVTRYMERFDRFPSPLVTPGPAPPGMVQSRDFLPHRPYPTAPPGPEIPAAVDSDPSPREAAPSSAPAKMTAQVAAPAAEPMASLSPSQLPYAMTDDKYMAFLVPQ